MKITVLGYVPRTAGLRFCIFIFVIVSFIIFLTYPSVEVVVKSFSNITETMGHLHFFRFAISTVRQIPGEDL